MTKVDQRALRISISNLVLIFFTIFICPLFPISYLSFIYPICFLFIFILVILSLGQNRRFNLYSIVVLTLLLLTSLITNATVFRDLIRITEILFFIYLLIRMVAEIARVKRVNRQVILDAVTGYFLLGLAYSTLVTLLGTTVKTAYSFSPNGEAADFEPLKDYMYYSFITFTTTGYGDVLPMTPASKSLAILIGVSGQLYIAVVIAMLVGKYTSRQDEA